MMSLQYLEDDYRTGALKRKVKIIISTRRNPITPGSNDRKYEERKLAQLPEKRKVKPN